MGVAGYLPDAQHSGLLEARIRAELELLAQRLGVPVRTARALFDEVAPAPLAGPFLAAGRRFSGLQRDGMPFEWSVSAGRSPGGLRFVVDHGEPGTSMTERTRRSLRTLARLLEALGVGTGLAGSYEQILRRLLPPLEMLDRLVMGIWLAIAVDKRGRVGLKVYVNQQWGTWPARYVRLAACLITLGRGEGLARLDAFARAAGNRLEPGGIAIELGSGRVGRVKLYLRVYCGDPAFLTRIASALGCHDPWRLELYNRVMARSGGYDPRFLIVSVEFGEDDERPSFKLDVNCMRWLASDREVHARALDLISECGADEAEYLALIETCAPVLASGSVDRFTWLGTALRGPEQRVNVYLHPGREACR